MALSCSKALPISVYHIAATLFKIPSKGSSLTQAVAEECHTTDRKV